MGIKEGENLREKIESTKSLLAGEIDYKFGREYKKSGDTIAFSFDLKGIGGAKDRDLQTMLSAYGVELTDDVQLIELMKELIHMKRYFERTSKDMRGGQDKQAEMLEEIKSELRSKIAGSTYLKNLGDEWETRLDGLEMGDDPSLWRYVLRESMEEFAFQIEQELDAVKGARVMIKDPDLMEMYSQLTDMTATATAMEADKETVEQCESAIKDLGAIYGELATINKSLDDPKVSGDEKDGLEGRKKILIEHIYEKVSVENAKPQKGIERIKSMFSEDGQLQVDGDEFMSIFREGLEDLAFETNSRNGKVDEKMLKRDVYDIKRVDVMDSIDAANKIMDPEARDKKIAELAKTDDMKKYAKLLDLQRKLARIIELQEEIEKLEDLIAKVEAALNANKVPANEIDSLIAKKDAAVQKLGRLKDAMTALQDKVKRLAQNLNLSEIAGVDFKSADALNVALGQANNMVEGERNNAQKRKENACARYGADHKKSYGEITSTMRERVEEIKKKKPVKENEVNAPTENPPVEPPTDGSPATNNAPRGSTPPTPVRQGKETPINIPHSSFGNGGTVPPKVEPTRPPTEHDDNEVNAPDSPEPAEESLDTMAARFEAEGKMPKKPKLLKKFEVANEKLQINTLEPEERQRIEAGYVYRYTRGSKPGELYFYQEPLEMYLENPMDDLEASLDGLRKRFETELGGSKEVKEFLANNPHNEILDGLLSKNPIKRNAAKRKFFEKLEDANKGEEEMAYVSMTIALQSEIDPQGISDTLSRYSQPYNRPTDMSRYVHLVEQKGFFGKSEKLEISDAMKDWMKKNRPKDDRSKKAPKKASINLDKTTDGMYSLFTYSPAEMGEEPSKEQPKKPHNKDPKKPRDPKKGHDKRNGRKNRRDSAPVDRD